MPDLNQARCPIGIIVRQSDEGLRLEVFLAKNVPGLSRHKAIELIRAGGVLVNGRKVKKGVRVSAGQTIELAPETRTRTVLPALETRTRTVLPALKTRTRTSIPVVLFTNQELLVINKPAGIPCHPLRLEESGTLLQWVGEQYPEVLTAGTKPREGGLLHRLDTDTSGCVAFARTPQAFEKWSQKFLEKGIEKYYLAIVEDGDVFNNEALPEIGGSSLVIDLPLARSSSDAGCMVAMITGDEKHRGNVMDAHTEIRTLAKGDGCALVEAKIERGRMHQIRVHLASIGHPIIGDKIYNPNCGQNSRQDCGMSDIGRQALHAWRLETKGLNVVAPVPEDMKKCLNCDFFD